MAGFSDLPGLSDLPGKKALGAGQALVATDAFKFCSRPTLEGWGLSFRGPNLLLCLLGLFFMFLFCLYKILILQEMPYHDVRATHNKFGRQMARVLEGRKLRHWPKTENHKQAYIM